MPKELMASTQEGLQGIDHSGTRQTSKYTCPGGAPVGRCRRAIGSREDNGPTGAHYLETRQHLSCIAGRGVSNPDPQGPSRATFILEDGYQDGP